MNIGLVLSGGGVVGELYTSGCGWKEILVFFNKFKLFTISKYAINKHGFIDSEKPHENFKPYLPLDDFKMLKKIFNLGYNAAVETFESENEIQFLTKYNNLVKI